MTSERTLPDRAGASINKLSGFASPDTLRTAAKNACDLGVWDWLDGGAAGEVSLRENLQAADRIKLVSRILRDVSRIDTRRACLGLDFAWPLVISPMGNLTMFHEDGEAELARGAVVADLPLYISALTRLSLAEIRAAAPRCRLNYQLYFQGSRSWIEDQLAQAAAVGCETICVCADAPVRVPRYRDRENRFDGREWGRRTNPSPPDHALGSKATWEDIKWLRDVVRKPLIIKGVMCAADAVLAQKIGLDAIWISNHGGRQFDGGLTAYEILPDIRHAVGANYPMIADGGIRSGIDVLKMLALGADLVGAGRPFVYGLLAAGAQGVVQSAAFLREELTAAMGNAGIVELSAISQDMVFRPSR